MDLWPCSTKDLDHLAPQEWLAKNSNNKVADKSAMLNSPGLLEKGTTALISNGTASGNVVYPDITQMVIYSEAKTWDWSLSEHSGYREFLLHLTPCPLLLVWLLEVKQQMHLMKY